MAPSDMVIESTVVVELWEQLLVRERESDEQENAFLAREHDVVEAECALGRMRMECGAVHEQVGAVQQDYQARVRTTTASQRRSLEFDRVLSGCQFILFMQETDLEHREEMWVEDQARGLCPPDGRNLSLELGKLHERVAKAEDDRAVEAEQLSRSIREIFDALVDLIVLPIQDVPSQPWLAKDVLVAFSLVLERLREEAPVHKPDA
jgi:hypothetical protein